jgi:hypothetical protein
VQEVQILKNRHCLPQRWRNDELVELNRAKITILYLLRELVSARNLKYHKNTVVHFLPERMADYRPKLLNKKHDFVLHENDLEVSKYYGKTWAVEEHEMKRLGGQIALIIFMALIALIVRVVS